MPYPLRDGESVVVHALTRAMCAEGCAFTLLVMNTPKHPADIKILPDDYRNYKEIYTVDVDTNVKAIDAFLNLFSKKSYNISRFDNADFRAKLIDLLQKNKYDIVQLESLFLTPYISTIRENSDAKIVLRGHNVEYEIWQRMYENEGFLPKKWYLKLLAARLRNYEIAQFNLPDLIVGITERDNEQYRNLGAKIKMHVAPAPVNLDFLPKQNLENKDFEEKNFVAKKNLAEFTETMQIGFLGSLDWLPNMEGIVWFLENVWQFIHAKHSNWQLNIAGRNTPNEFKTQWHNLEKKINVLGEVSDSQLFTLSNDAMIVPILSGSGMRIKIVEAMALGSVVITTTIGAEGIDGVHNRDFMLADTPEAFMSCLELCAETPDLRQNIRKNAADFIKENFDAAIIAKKLVDVYGDLL